MNVFTTPTPDQFPVMIAYWRASNVSGTDGMIFKVSTCSHRVMIALGDDNDMITAAVHTAVNDFAARGDRPLGVAGAGSDGYW